MDWDVFISHASEDKESFVRPLASALRERYIKVWFDEFALRIGDSLRRSIDRGLASSRFGIVVLSPAFFRREWPQRELDGLLAREIRGSKVVLPVWHNVSHEQVASVSPMLADRLATTSSLSLGDVVDQLVEVILPAAFAQNTAVRYLTQDLGFELELVRDVLVAAPSFPDIVRYLMDVKPERAINVLATLDGPTGARRHLNDARELLGLSRLDHEFLY